MRPTLEQVQTLVVSEVRKAFKKNQPPKLCYCDIPPTIASVASMLEVNPGKYRFYQPLVAVYCKMCDAGKGYEANQLIGAEGVRTILGEEPL